MRSETARYIEKMMGKKFGWLDLDNNPNSSGETPPLRMRNSDYLNPEEEKLIREIFEDARNKVIDLLIKNRKK
jgi:hypothetical protein